jgi:membrane-associated phospholipid phosphatase
MEWGIGVILALQKAPGWTSLMKAFTFLGNKEFFLFVMPAVYWCVDASVGARLALVLIASNGVNALGKIALHLPRPYWFDPRVRALSSELSYGLPSGHAMNSVSIWGFLAAQMRKAWAWVVAAVIVLGVSISRLYLGVHFPTDVFAGWILGALLLVAVLRCERPAVAWLHKRTFWQQIALWLALSLLYLALYGGILAALAPTPDPVEWEQNAAAATGPAATGPVDDEPATDPRSTEDGLTMAGMLFGYGLAYALGLRWPTRFDARGPLAKRVLRFVVGAAGVGIFYLGLRLVTPDGPTLVVAIMRYVRYVLVIAWAMYAAPWTFVKLKLATSA